MTRKFCDLCGAVADESNSPRRFVFTEKAIEYEFGEGYLAAEINFTVGSGRGGSLPDLCLPCKIKLCVKLLEKLKEEK